MTFFRFVRQHYGAFFWACLLWLVGVIALGTRFAWPLWVQCLLLLPMDLAAWPVCLEVWKAGSLPLATRRFAFLLALLPPFLALLLLLDMV